MFVLLKCCVSTICFYWDEVVRDRSEGKLQSIVCRLALGATVYNNS
jgi:hypothetical protein